MDTRASDLRTISTAIQEGALTALDKLARERATTRAYLVREAVRAYLKDHGIGAPRVADGGNAAHCDKFAVEAEIFLHLNGRPLAHERKDVLVLETKDGIAVVASEYTESGLSFYRLADGRRCNDQGIPSSWDFWRLDVAGLERRLRADKSGRDDNGTP